MKDRGDYRSFYASFWDDVDVHALSDRAYRVLTTLKGVLPASGLGVIYALQMAERCACTPKQLEAALAELERPKADGSPGWIMRERNVVWIVNGLAFEPGLAPKDPKHRKFIRKTTLPFRDRPIGLAFRARYAAYFADDRDDVELADTSPIEGASDGLPTGIEGEQKAHRRGIEGPSKGLPRGIEGASKHIDVDGNEKPSSSSSSPSPAAFAVADEDVLRRFLATAERRGANVSAWEARIRGWYAGNSVDAGVEPADITRGLDDWLLRYGADEGPIAPPHLRGFMRSARDARLTAPRAPAPSSANGARRAVATTGEADAVRAFDAAMEFMHANGGYLRITSELHAALDERTKRALSACGGFKNLGTTNEIGLRVARKDFIAAYLAQTRAASSGNTAARASPDVHVTA